ncbi:hypothetical protein AXZ95_0119 [Leifsonia sp. 115AMFTsu3.1]|nr:hypothetical protein AXZ95_0119 [Leifsonia sp. 115AMFTsu3.1]
MSLSDTRRVRARFRQLALLEPYSSAARHLTGTATRSPLVPTALDAQQTLEGEVLCGLGYLHEPRSFTVGDGPFVITRISAESDSLTLELSADSAPDKLCYRLLPSWEPGSETVDNGIVGLRYRLDYRASAVDFYFPGRRARVTFSGIDVDNFVRLRNEWIRSGVVESIDGKQGPTRQERVSALYRHIAAPVASAFVRRFGLLMQLEPRWIDSWSSMHRYSVEVSVHEQSLPGIPGLIDQLTSPWLEPRFSRRGDHETVGYYMPLSLEGTDLELDLRFTTL